MKLLHVISSVNPLGGGPIEWIKQINPPLQGLGVEIEIACCDELGRYVETSINLPLIHSLGPPIGRYSYTPKLIPWLSENAPRFDVVIVHGVWTFVGRAARQALADSKTPYFVFTHGNLDPWFKQTYPLKHLKKWIYWLWAGYKVLRDARAVIFTCEEERILAKQSFWLYKANEVVTSFGTSSPPDNGDELAGKFLISNPGLVDKRIVLFLSRIHEKKGCDLLLAAFARVAESDLSLHLVMAGPDQTGWQPSLQAQADRLGIGGRITWPGMLQGDIKWGAFYSAEVFCLPSHQENFGIVVAEALACGKPVLISNKVNIWREIQTDDAGFIDEDTIEGTARNLERWLALTPTGYSQMSEKSKLCFTDRFHIQSAAEHFLDIIINNMNSE